MDLPGSRRRRRQSTAALLAISVLMAGSAALAEDTEATARHAALLDKLVASYPNFLASHDGAVLRWKDGTEMAFDDGKGDKDFDTRLNQADIEDMFYAPYPVGRAGTPSGIDIDPGRVRYGPFFNKMYGDCTKREVPEKLVPVVWLPSHDGKKVLITRVNGVAEKLKAVSDELDAYPKDLVKYLTPPGGTYNCRVIAGTNRQSAHGNGIAIDINVAWSDYWRDNRSVDGKYPYKNRIPWDIVEVFEKHGFIWGGKWYHYDTMHFEYRPELLP
ncbi:MAG: M15 family metallopeptidase [Methyloceanibacter sp.]